MNPFALLLAVFIIVPLVEIYFLIQVGEIIGALPTVGLVVLTAVVGVGLLRIQGFTTLRRAQAALAQGQPPAIEMLEGVVLLIAGALLLTPGFATDTLGFLCLIPPIRRAVILGWLRRHLARSPFGGPGNGPRPPRSGHNIIDGEYRREDD